MYSELPTSGLPTSRYFRGTLQISRWVINYQLSAPPAMWWRVGRIDETRMKAVPSTHIYLESCIWNLDKDSISWAADEKSRWSISIIDCWVDPGEPHQRASFIQRNCWNILIKYFSAFHISLTSLFLSYLNIIANQCSENMKIIPDRKESLAR